MSKSSRSNPAKIVFVTGTDTGAGKTLLTALLLDLLRRSGVRALAMKPFCSGSRADVEFLSAVQNHELPTEMLNPFYFREPIAPLIAARKQGSRIELKAVVARIREVQKSCDCLLVEGSGGLMVPLGEDYSVLDLINKLGGPVIVAARNRLGVINHAVMTIKIMEYVGVKINKIVLMGCKRSDISAHTNRNTLAELLPATPVYQLPFLAGRWNRLSAIKSNRKKTKKTLAQILGADTLSYVHCEHAVRSD